MTEAALTPYFKLQTQLNTRKVRLWRMLFDFASLKDAHGVHDMAVEIQGIEVMEKMLRDD